jgi:hypothetical protein
MTTELDKLLRKALTEFTKKVFATGWHGREREAISLFVLGYLINQVRSESLLRDRTQIGIEVAVPSLKKLNPKGRVNKDLVIWPVGEMTLWDADWKEANTPLAVLEWKVFRKIHRTADLAPADLQWLTRWTRAFPKVTGYAVALDLAQRQFRLQVARCENGIVQREWLQM